MCSKNVQKNEQKIRDHSVQKLVHLRAIDMKIFTPFTVGVKLTAPFVSLRVMGGQERTWPIIFGGLRWVTRNS